MVVSALSHIGLWQVNFKDKCKTRALKFLKLRNEVTRWATESSWVIHLSSNWILIYIFWRKNKGVMLWCTDPAPSPRKANFYSHCSLQGNLKNNKTRTCVSPKQLNFVSCFCRSCWCFQRKMLKLIAFFMQQKEVDIFVKYARHPRKPWNSTLMYSRR